MNSIFQKVLKPILMEIKRLEAALEKARRAVDDREDEYKEWMYAKQKAESNGTLSSMMFEEFNSNRLIEAEERLCALRSLLYFHNSGQISQFETKLAEFVARYGSV